MAWIKPLFTWWESFVPPLRNHFCLGHPHSLPNTNSGYPASHPHRMRSLSTPAYLTPSKSLYCLSLPRSILGPTRPAVIRPASIHLIQGKKRMCMTTNCMSFMLPSCKIVPDQCLHKNSKFPQKWAALRAWLGQHFAREDGISIRQVTQIFSLKIQSINSCN